MIRTTTSHRSNHISSRAISLGSPSHPEFFGGEMSMHDADEWAEMNAYDPFDFDGARAYRAMN